MRTRVLIRPPTNPMQDLTPPDLPALSTLCPWIDGFAKARIVVWGDVVATGSVFCLDWSPLWNTGSGDSKEITGNSQNYHSLGNKRAEHAKSTLQ